MADLPVKGSIAAASSKEFFRDINSSTLGGQYVAFNMGLPQLRFPSATDLGLVAPGALSINNQYDLFPFKDNSLALTEIEVPTTIMILDKKTSNIQLQTNRFILQSISKPEQERFQIIETFGEPSVYFYDQRTRVYTLQGMLLDSEDPKQIENQGGSLSADKAKGKYYWATAFQAFYDDYLRGTKLKDSNSIAALFVDNNFIKGYPIQLVLGKSSGDTAHVVTFQMTWVIESETLLSRRKAEWLFKQGRVNKETVAAINAYFDALNTYNLAYVDWNREATPVGSVTALSTKKDAAETAVIQALKAVKAALDKAAGQSSK